MYISLNSVQVNLDNLIITVASAGTVVSSVLNARSFKVIVEDEVAILLYLARFTTKEHGSVKVKVRTTVKCVGVPT